MAGEANRWGLPSWSLSPWSQPSFGPIPPLWSQNRTSATPSTFGPIQPPPCVLHSTENDSEDAIRSVVSVTLQRFPMCKDILTSGMTQEELNISIRCISLIMGHETVLGPSGGRNTQYECCLGLEKCPFCLHFRKQNGLWYLNRNKINSVSRNCSTRSFPEICCTKSFLQFIIMDWMKNNGKSVKDIKTKDVMTFLTNFGMDGVHRRTVDRIVSEVTCKSAEKVLESEQKIEDYVRYLNANEQYAVLLYDSGELVFPTTKGNDTDVKLCPLGENPAFCEGSTGNGRKFWEDLADVHVRADKESVLYTFQAVAFAVKAFPLSFPVICLDACFIKCPHTTAVLMTASFMTTEGHILSMCHGTAPSETIESWAFFLTNLRQVVTLFCGNIDWSKISFMSDRNQGILSGVNKFFSESHQLFCVIHLLRNVNTKGMDIVKFWEAVESLDEQALNRACEEALAPKLIELKAVADSWVRYRIWLIGIRRYGFRSNNLSESLNNALRDIRRGPLLHVLLCAFRYTTVKFNEYRTFAATYEIRLQKNNSLFTDFAMYLYYSNWQMAKNCTLMVLSDSEWQVQDSKREFHVTLLSSGEFFCSCLRSFDEEVPCQHILKVFDHTKKVFPYDEMIGKIYLKENFKLAFLQGRPFWPKDHDLYVPNPSVVPRTNNPPKRGATRTRRFAGPGENPKSHSVSRPPLKQDPREESYEPSSDGPDESSIAAIELHHIKRAAIDMSLAAHGCLDEHSSSYAMEFLDSLGPCSSDEDGRSVFASSDEDGRSVCASSDEDGRSMFASDTELTESSPSKDLSVDDHSACILVEESADNCEATSVGQGCNNRAPTACRKRVAVNVGVRKEQIERACCLPEVVCLEHMKDIPKSHFIRRGPTFLWNKGSSPEKRTRCAANVPSSCKRAKRVPEINASTIKQTELVTRSAIPIRTEKEHTDDEKNTYIQMLCHHEEAMYRRWESFYNCTTEIPHGFLWHNNEIPSLDAPLTFPVLWRYPAELVRCMYDESTKRLVNDHLIHLSDSIQRDSMPPFHIALSFFQAFLARAHPFTAVGLEVQGMAYYRGESRLVKYLVLYPQINEPDRVTNRDDDCTTPTDTFRRFDALDPNPKQEEYHVAFWIHTHPRWEAFMSPTDIRQLYYHCPINCPRGIVVSPRQTGVKMLFVELTREGIDELRSYDNMYCSSKQLKKHYGIRDRFLLEKIRESRTKFYTRIPFSVSSGVSCIVADFRTEEQVCNRIREFINNDEADWDWFP